MKVQCHAGFIAGDKNCNYCVQQKRCEAFKIAKNLAEKEKGNEINEFLERINNGEDTRPDDIKMPDSNKCSFLKKIIKNVKEYDEAISNANESYKPFFQELKELKPQKERIKRIYEDDDFIVDLFPEDRTIRVSVFDDGHFKDEVFVRKDDYCE